MPPVKFDKNVEFFELASTRSCAPCNFLFVIKMNLTNIFGLTGVMFLLQILNSMEMSFGMACCLLLLSEKEKDCVG